MKVNFRWTAIWLCFIFSFSIGNAQDDFEDYDRAYLMTDDTLAFEARYFDTTSLYKLKSLSEYNYDNDPKYETDFWGYLKGLFYKFIRNLFGDKGAETFMDLVYYSIFGFGILLLVYYLFKMQGTSILKRESEEDEDISLEVIDDNLSAEKLDELLTIALAQSNYRAAVRIHYLRILKLLDENEWIKWKEYKTDNDFINEISSPKIRDPFKKITWIYENIWYGEHAIDLDYYEEFNAQVNQFNTIIKN